MNDDPLQIVMGNVLGRTDQSSAVVHPNEPFSVEQMLHLEYTRAVTAANFEWERILRIAGIGFSAAGALLFLIANENIDFGEWSYWIAPLILTLLYALIIQTLYSMGFHSYYVRDLEDDLARRTGVTYLHYENTVVRALFSIRTGYARSLATYAIILMFAWVFYLAVVLLCFNQIHSLGTSTISAQPPNPDSRTGHSDVPLWREVAFLWVNILLMGVLLWSAWGTVAGLKSRYDKWITMTSNDSDAIATRQDTRSPFWELMSYAFLPRRFDFLFKSLFTVTSLVITSLILGVEFSERLFWIGFWVVFCVDFLAKQTTYIWNDLLDEKLDSRHSYKSNARPLGRLKAHKSGKFFFVARTLTTFVASFVLAAELNLRWLPWLIGIIFLWQFLYDRWAKRWPLSRLLVASLGYVERASAGALAAMATTGQYDLILAAMLSSWIVVFMLMVLSEFWWAERRHSLSEKMATASAPEKESLNTQYDKLWFAKYGQRIQKWANYCLFPLGLALAFLYTESRQNGVRNIRDDSVNFVSKPWGWLSSVCSALKELWLNLRDLGPLTKEQSGILAIVLTVLGITCAYKIRMDLVGGLAAAQGTTKEGHIADPTKVVRGKWSVIWFICTLAAFPLLPVFTWLYILVFSLAIFGVVNYESLTYEDFIEFEKKLTQAARNLLPWIDWLLFQPWALRVNIYPIAISGSADKASSEWAKALSTQYQREADNIGYNVMNLGCDGHGEFDFVVWGEDPRFDAFRKEEGFHIRTFLPKGDSVLTGELVDVVWVELAWMAVAARTEMGHGLDIKQPERISVPLAKWSEKLQRILLISTDQETSSSINHRCVRFYWFSNEESLGPGQPTENWPKDDECDQSEEPPKKLRFASHWWPAEAPNQERSTSKFREVLEKIGLGRKP